jgi:threonine aldolase
MTWRVDLYSDTQTRPTPAMRAAMADAPVGDEQQGGDPTVSALCAEVAERLGQEDALFLPSGTMCNLVAVATHTRPGDAIVLDRLGHIARSETGGAAAVNGVVTDLLAGTRGIFSPDQLAEALQPGNVYRPHPRLVCLEQTHNFGGGTVWPLDRWQAVIATATEAGVPVHVDGARLYNAVVASGIDAARWGEGVASVWIDFTKGLGAPLGAVLAGSRPFIAAARPFKHRFGGALRQAGIAAAGCRHALAHHVDRLADDHANAQRLAAGLRAVGIPVEEPVETNMLWFDPSPCGWSAAALAAALAEVGVRISVVGERARAATHLDVSSADIDDAVAAVDKLLAGGPPRTA